MGSRTRFLALAGALLCGCGSGLSAQDLVTDAHYSRLTFEIDSVRGITPSRNALQTLVAQLQNLNNGGYIRKPAGITTSVQATDVPPSSEANHAYSVSELQELASAHRSLHGGNGEAVVQVLYVDGHFVEDNGQERV